MPDPVSPNPSVNMETPKTDDGGPLVYCVLPEHQAEYEAYCQNLELAFGGMDPLEWVAELNQRLLRATQSLDAARLHHRDPSKDITNSTEAEAVEGVRAGVTEYLSSLYEMLGSMPLFQQQPHIVEALQFIVAGIADVGRGAAPDWLYAPATKRHPKPLNKESEWVPIIAALELCLLLPEVNNFHAAVEKINSLTKRRVGTIKDWHTKLYRNGKIERPAAYETIQHQVEEVRALLRLGLIPNRTAFIERKVAALLE